MVHLGHSLYTARGMKLRLREVREQKLMTQGELAKLAGLTRSQLNRIENHKVDPRMGTVRKLIVALGVEPSELIVRE